MELLVYLTVEQSQLPAFVKLNVFSGLFCEMDKKNTSY